MLDNKDDIEEYADVSEGKLGWVSGQARPVALQIGVDSQL